jgi:exopolysaccharide biosynthesis polyprenyl glycosylphosphotransferase
MIRLFRVSIPTSVLVLILAECVLIYACLLSAAWVFLADELEIFLLYDNGMERLGIVVITVMLTFYFKDGYNDFSVRSKLILIQDCVFALGVSILIQALVAYLFPGWIAPRWILFLGGLLLCLIFPFWRLAYQRFFLSALGAQSVLFLGANSLAQDIAVRLHERPELGMRSLGFIADGTGSEVAALKVLGPVSEFTSIVGKSKPDCIIVGMTERRQKLPMEELLRLRFAGIRIEEAATTFQTVFSRVPIRGLRHSQLIFSSELGPLPRNLRVQTFYSTVLAALALALLAPLMLLVAIAVLVTSRGPVLFRQTRVGLGGKPFTIYKFRSMKVDAEAGTGAVWASRNDPRVTVIGGYLRRTRLDELPQLFNVLQREMSIVGPRPERPEFVKTLSELIPFYAHRHSVKPGITGWAQINYKYGESVEDAIIKLEYELYYIKNLSPGLDFYVIFHTLKAMLASRSGQ